jgi:hypothetical protein
MSCMEHVDDDRDLVDRRQPSGVRVQLVELGRELADLAQAERGDDVLLAPELGQFAFEPRRDSAIYTPSSR